MVPGRNRDNYPDNGADEAPIAGDGRVCVKRVVIRGQRGTLSLGCAYSSPRNTEM
jgi:hypothetical protein